MQRAIVVAYFIAVMADAAISLASILTTPSLETFSNSFSLLMFGLTLVVLFLAFRAKLRPILPVLVPALLYVSYFWFGIALSIAVQAKTAPGVPPSELNHATLRQLFGWYHDTVVALMALQLAVGAGSLWGFVRGRDGS